MACKGAKEFLSSKGIAYTEHNVAADAEALKKMVGLTGGSRAVPVITVGEDVLIGFDRGKLQRLLGI